MVRLAVELGYLDKIEELEADTERLRGEASYLTDAVIPALREIDGAIWARAEVDLGGNSIQLLSEAEIEENQIREMRHLSEIERLQNTVDAARQAIQYSIDMGGTDPAGVLLQALNKCDAALGHRQSVASS